MLLISIPYPPFDVIVPTFNEPYYPYSLTPRYETILPIEIQLLGILLPYSPQLTFPSETPPVITPDTVKTGDVEVSLAAPIDPAFNSFI